MSSPPTLCRRAGLAKNAASLMRLGPRRRALARSRRQRLQPTLWSVDYGRAQVIDWRPGRRAWSEPMVRLIEAPQLDERSRRMRRLLDLLPFAKRVGEAR